MLNSFITVCFGMYLFSDGIPEYKFTYFINSIIILTGRAFTIGVKYGFYSDYHMHILKSTKMSQEFLLSNLSLSRVLEFNPIQI